MNNQQKIFYKLHSDLNIKGKYNFNHNLSKNTWFGIAGNAEIFFVPDDLTDLKLLLENRPKEMNITILGLGSNVIIRDGGISGVVMKLGKSFSNIVDNGEELVVGAAAHDKVLAKFCLNKSIGGFEFLFGIPGSIGGAISMNAGCYGFETKDIFKKAKCITFDGKLCELKNSEHMFTYRKNNKINNLLIYEVYFKKKIKEKKLILNEMTKIDEERKKSQPQKVRTAGSTFKNPKNQTNEKAWSLIKKSNQDILKKNGISFSREHANFIVNTQFISANHIEDFGEEVRRNVRASTGINLEWEIKILGNR